MNEENVRSPWVIYEAGFIAAKLADASLCTLLLGVGEDRVRGTPLGQFQWTRADDRDGVERLVQSANKRLPTPHHPTLVGNGFREAWGRLKRSLDQSAGGREPVASAEPLVGRGLSHDALEMIQVAASDPDANRAGKVMRHSTLREGVHISAGGRDFAHGDAR